MDDRRRRSMFGELVVQHRQRLGLSQEDLSRRVAAFAESGSHLEASFVSVNTIQNWERRRGENEHVPKPFAATVTAVARALELELGSPGHATFLRAARSTSSSGQTEGHAFAWPDANPFFVAGRQDHLTRLDELVSRTMRWQPDIALVRADAGTGKSHLIAEACRRALLDPEGSPVVIWIECSSLDRTSDSFVPVRQIVDLLVGGARFVGPRTLVTAENRERLLHNSARAIRTMVEQSPGLIDRVIDVDLLLQRATAADADDDVLQALRRISQQPAAMRGESLGAGEEIFRLLTGYSRHTPVLLVIEDMHWAHERTCLLLQDLAMRMRQHPARIGIIASYRPTEPPIVSESRSHPFRAVAYEIHRHYPDAEVDLSTSVGGDNGLMFVEEFVSKTFAEVPGDFIQSMFARTAGVPLIARGLIDIFRRDGVVETDDDQVLVLTRTPDWSEIPSSTNAMFSERLERLSPSALSMLRCAALMGATFHAEIVKHAVEYSDDEFIDLLSEQLVRRHRLVHASGPVRIASRRVHEFRFEHEVLRDIVVRQIGFLERQRLHARIGASMEALFGRKAHEVAAIMAWHYEQAGDETNAGLCYKAAGDYALRTNRFHITSGDFALSSDEFSGAVAYFHKAHQLIDEVAEPETLAGVILGLANCARASAEANEALRLAHEALAVSQRNDLTLMTSHCMTSLAMIDYDAGEMERAIELLTDANSILPGDADDGDRGRIMALLSHNLYGVGRYDAAIDAARLGYGLAKRAKDSPLELEALLGETNCLVDLGLFAEAIPSYERMLDMAQDYQNPRSTSLSLVNLGLCCLEQREWGRALGYIERAREVVTAAFIPRIEGYVQYYRGLVEEGRGNLIEAHTLFEQARETRIRHSQFALAMDATAGLLRVAVARRDMSETRRNIDDLELRIAERGVVGVEHTIRLYLAMVSGHSLLGHHGLAVDYCRKAKLFLDEHAGSIASEAYRHSYLTNVPAHREICDWIARYQISGSIGE